MAEKKIKISQLPIADTLEGLYTIGVNALNKSVKVSLQFLKTAADRADTSAKKADEATTEATNAAANANEAARDARDEINRMTDLIESLPGASTTLEYVYPFKNETGYGGDYFVAKNLPDGRMLSEFSVWLFRDATVNRAHRVEGEDKRRREKVSGMIHPVHGQKIEPSSSSIIYRSNGWEHNFKTEFVPIVVPEEEQGFRLSLQALGDDLPSVTSINMGDLASQFFRNNNRTISLQMGRCRSRRIAIPDPWQDTSGSGKNKTITCRGIYLALMDGTTRISNYLRLDISVSLRMTSTDTAVITAGNVSRPR